MNPKGSMKSSSNRHGLRILADYPYIVLGALVILGSTSSIVWWIAGSYLGVDQYSSRSFWSDDGWCSSSVQGIGVHCFGDYYYPLYLAGLPNPWGTDSANPYPPASLLPFLLFNFVGTLLQEPRLGLLMYLFTTIIGICVSVWVAARRMNFGWRLVLVGVIAVASPPVISALDRGNSVGLLVPLLIWLYLALLSENKTGIILSIAALALVKPHLGLLVLVPLLRGDFKSAFRALSITVSVHLIVAIVLWGQLFPLLFRQITNQVFGFQNYGSISSPWPPSISFAHGVYAWFSALDALLPLDLKPLLNSIESTSSYIGFGILGLVILMLLLARKVIGGMESAVVLTASIVMTSATTYFYYSIFCVATFVAVTNALLSPRRADPLGANDVIRIALLLASGLSLVQFPLLGLQEGLYTQTSATLIPSYWIMAFIAVAGILVSRFFSARKAAVEA